MKKLEKLNLKEQATLTQAAADNFNAIAEKIDELVEVVNFIFANLLK